MTRLVRTPALVDAAFLLALLLVASLGLGGTYTGWSYLVAAGFGALLGIALAYLAAVLERPVVLVAVGAIVSFFLFGGAVALRSTGISAALPLPSTIVELTDQSIHGWKDLLTSLAPVDGGPLLTLPYLMGIGAGAAGMSLAGRLRSPMLPALVPVGYLAAVILLGIQLPAHLRLIGAMFAGLTVVWVATRARRSALVVTGRPTQWRRRGVAALLIGGAVASATLVGPMLPGADSRERVVLRTYITPPFDVGQYPSPLAGFRQYTKGYRVPKGQEERRLYNQELMRVDGLPAGSLLRFAALDQYRGTVWGASNQAPGTTGSAGAFQRVGQIINDTGDGEEVEVKITLADAYRSVWLPTTGDLTTLEFTGDRAEQEADGFRYNLATDTGVVPQGLGGGDSYAFTARLPDDDDIVKKDMTVSSDSVSIDESGSDFNGVAQRWGGSAAPGIRQILAIAEHLRTTGRYTDGGSENEAQFPAGHSVARLSSFSVEGQQIAGNDEQYAAMLGLLATQAGVPARVVVGARVPDDRVVRGKDVRVWLEIKDASGTWRVLPTEAFMSRERPPEDQPPTPQQLVSGEVIPPPAAVRPSAAAGDPLATDDNRRRNDQANDGGHSLPPWLFALLVYVGVPVLAVGLVLGALVGGKRWRRRRRRTIGTPAARASAAWREVLDAGRDFGLTVTGQRTRREQAVQLGVDGAAALARDGDRHVFGPSAPTDGDVQNYWRAADELRADLARSHSRWQRFRAAVSLSSFLPLSRAGG